MRFYPIGERESVEAARVDWTIDIGCGHVGRPEVNRPPVIVARVGIFRTDADIERELSGIEGSAEPLWEEAVNPMQADYPRAEQTYVGEALKLLGIHDPEELPYADGPSLSFGEPNLADRREVFRLRELERILANTGGDNQPPIEDRVPVGAGEREMFERRWQFKCEVCERTVPLTEARADVLFEQWVSVGQHEIDLATVAAFAANYAKMPVPTRRL